MTVLFYIRAGKVFLGTTLLATGAVVGGVYYANVDPKFRQNVEDTIPYSSSLLNAILGKGGLQSKPAPKKAPLGVSVRVCLTKTSSILFNAMLEKYF